MRENKGVYVTRRDIKKHHREYQHSSNKIVRSREYSVDRVKYDSNTQEVGCQYDSRRDNIVCTCRNVSTTRRRQEISYFSGIPKQIYAYHGLRSHIDIGVGSIKTLPRKKVKRVYLPETDDRGVGSSELSVSNRRTIQNKGDSYYDHKRTSSKCVGGIIEYNTGCVTSAKLSPIIHTRSGTTSPAVSMNYDNNAELGSNTVEKKIITITTQVDDELVTKYGNVEEKKLEDPTPAKQISEQIARQSKSKETFKNALEKDKSRITRRTREPEKAYSSDSLVQHVHDLEMPSEDKSRMSMDPMENKLEREYRKMFSIKSKESKPSSEKPIPDFKSTSMLRRRFEALRRGIVKKEDSKNVTIVDTKISHTSVPSCKDVSIASDPPSLEGRSYSNTKTYSPFQSNVGYNKDIYNPSTSYKKSYTGKQEQDNSQWPPTEGYDDDSQGVKGMFKIWGKKFNLEETYYDEKASPRISYDKNIPKIIEKKLETVKAKSKPEPHEKKEGRKFFFFKRKSKDKEKQPYKSKKGVTAGRCEVGDGLMIKIGATANYNTEEIKQPEIVSTEYEEILRNAWLTKYLSHKIDSRKSVQVRWNNNTYATSSSTIFELMDDVYRETGVVFRSKSEITTGESSYYKSYTRQRVNFMQNIEAWMIPKTICDKPADLRTIKNNVKRSDIEVRISDQKWFIDKSKAFSHNIEVVLHSNNFVKMNKQPSSEYLRIDIPKGFFVDSYSEEDCPNQSSIEEVYKIVEYESTTDFKKQRKILRKSDKGDDISNDIKVTISVKDSKETESKIMETVIKTPPIHRDVVIQGSNVYIPKRCDVIGVGIITQRDLRDMKKPILKIQADEISDEDSERIMKITPKKCEFAESYLQDYYRNWTPLGIDLFSWCVSDCHLRCSSENSHASFNYQGDGSKSCPNIFDDFQTSTVVSSCATSSCSHCNNFDGEQPEKKFTSNFMKKFKKKPKENPHKRCLPKDSLEVFKKRLIYAQSNKGNWGTADDEPYLVPSIEDKFAQKDTMVECPKKPCCKPLETKRKKKDCKKHVSLPDCETMNDVLARAKGLREGILSFKGVSGCDICKKQVKGVKCPKHASMDHQSPNEIPLPPCMPKCIKTRKPACLKANSPSCNVPPPCTPPCETPPEIPCAISSSSSVSSSCPTLPCASPQSSQSPTCSSSQPSTISPNSSGIKLSSPPHSPCPKPPPCPKPRRKCPKPPPPCPKPPPPCPKPPPACPKPPPPCPKPPPPCPKPPPCTEPVQGPRPCFPPPCPPLKCPAIQCPPQPCPSSPKRKKKSPLSSLIKCKTNKKTTCNPTPSPPCGVQEPPLCSQCQSSDSVRPRPSRPRNRSSSQSSTTRVCDNKACPIATRLSSLSPKTECKPECANRKSSPSPKCTKSKISGLFLKMLSKKKNSSKECFAGDSSNVQGCINQSNSRESINIKIKKETASTEEIREGVDIKVQDFDGQTLYERRNYRQGGCKNKATVLGDMYKHSNVHRMSAPITVENVTSETQGHESTEREEAMELKSDASASNLVEIQFKLRVTQGDKTTEIHVGNDKECEIEKSNQHNKSPQDIIYAVKNEDVHSVEDINPNNDINIRIVIKNYKPPNKAKNFEKCDDDEFSKKISDKFHTVSTGYSDVVNQNTDNVYSVRRTTINMAPSIDKSLNKTSEEVMAEELAEREPIHLMVSSHSAKSQKSTMSKKSVKKRNSSTGQIKETELSELSRSRYDNSNVTDTDRDVAFDLNTSIENSNESDANVDLKVEKKEMLKKIFEKVHNTKSHNKKKIKKLKDMLKLILTSDSSGQEDMAHVTSNELAKDVTYASLKPNYFRDTDSMTNYYKNDSTTLSSNIESKIDAIKFTHPTKENSSSCSSNSDNASTENITLIHQSCMCSTLAEKLNICETSNGRGCCCRANPKRNEETNCDLRNDEDFYLLNYKTTDYADVETQNSNYLSSKMNSANISIHNNLQTSNLKHVAVNVVDLKETQDEITITNIHTPHKHHMRECDMKKFNRHTILSISDEDKILVLEPKQTEFTQEQSKVKNEKESKEKRKERKHKEKRTRVLQGAEILQSYETKKAVLEIYAQKTISDGTEHIVAKLPKFTYERESDIRRNYEEIAENGYTRICKRNFVTMSYTR